MLEFTDEATGDTLYLNKDYFHVAAIIPAKHGCYMRLVSRSLAPTIAPAFVEFAVRETSEAVHKAWLTPIVFVPMAFVAERHLHSNRS